MAYNSTKHGRAEYGRYMQIPQTELSAIIEELDERDLDILVTIGAGDIDQLVGPIKIMLSTKYEISES